MRLIPRSLQARMLALSAVATIVALALAGWIVAGVLEGFVLQGLDRRLDSEIALLASTVEPDGRIARDRLRARIGALENEPGWQWRIAAPGGAVGSADFPDLNAREPREPDPGDGPPGAAGFARHGDHGFDDRIRPIDGTGGSERRVHARRLTIATTAGPVVLTAAAPREVVRRPIRAALAPLLAAMAALAVLLGLSTVVQLRVGLRPLRRLRDQVAAIRTGARGGVDEDQPSELRGLAMELNALAVDNATALAAARVSAANLAHALKTPVTALAIDLRAEPTRAAQVARIDATIRHHLARARLETIDRRAATALAPAVAGLVAAVSGLHAARGLAMDIDVPAELAVAIDGHDLDELIGNLLDNAARHARSRVHVEARPVPGDARHVRIVVRDDGPGIDASERARVAEPGVRLDERGDGHGFGLSIVTGLASLYGGALTLDEAPGGGLAATLMLPAAAG